MESPRQVSRCYPYHGMRQDDDTYVTSVSVPRPTHRFLQHEPSMEVASGSRRGRESPSSTKSGAGLWSRGSPNRAEDGEDDDSCGGGGLSVEAYLANQGKAKVSEGIVQ